MMKFALTTRSLGLAFVLMGLVGCGDDGSSPADPDAGTCMGAGLSTWYDDTDGDGLGDPAMTMDACDMPSGHVANADDTEPDCGSNDTDFCGVCGGDGSTCNDCAGDFGGSALLDSCDVCSGGTSGHTADSDQDVCGVCFGPGTITWYEDTDGDGQGDPGVSTVACTAPLNYVSDNTDPEPDCATNDTDVCGVCGGPGMITWYDDGDDDGLGDPSMSMVACLAPMLHVDNGDDLEPLCATNDTDACGTCAGPGPATWYDDTDGDGLGDPAMSMASCTMPMGYVADASDTQPGCVTNDENMCGQCGDPSVPTWYEDSDGDALGDPAVSMVACSMPFGYVADNTDPEPGCISNDTDVCGVCAGSGPTTWYNDEDDDGLGNPNPGSETTACGQPTGWVANNTDPEPFCTSNVVDVCDDCDGPGMVSWHLDLDRDGHGTTGVINTCPADTTVQSLLDDDCDDTNPNRWDDCGGCTDQDGDGYGSGCSLGPDCSDYSAFVWSACGACDRDDADGDGAGAGCDIDDCDPTDTTIFEGAFEIPGDGIDQDCDGMDLALDPSDAVYLAVDCPNGPTTSDLNAGTPDAPVATLSRALELAGRQRLIVAAGGTYGTIGSYTVYRGILGSYSCANGTWSPAGPARTQVQSSNSQFVVKLVSNDFDSQVVLHAVDVHATDSRAEAVNVDANDGEVYVVDVNASSDAGRAFLGGSSMGDPGLTMISNSTFHTVSPSDTSDDYWAATFFWLHTDLRMSGSTVSAGPIAQRWSTTNLIGGSYYLYDNDITGGSLALEDTSQVATSTLRGNRITAGVSNDGSFTSTGARIGAGATGYQVIGNTINASADPSAQVTVGAYVISDQGRTEMIGNFVDGGGGSVSAVGLQDHDNGGPMAWSFRSYNNHYQAGVSVASAGTVTGAQVNRGLWSANDVFLAGTGGVASIAIHVVRADDTVITHCVAESGDGASSYGVFADMTDVGGVTIDNCVLMSTGGTAESYAFYANTSEPITLGHCDLWPDAGATSSCLLYDDNTCLTTTMDVNACAWDGCTAAPGPISVDPQLDATYHITSAMNPLVDAGYLNFDTFPFGDIDIDEEDRFFDVAPDIGIDEYTP